MAKHPILIVDDEKNIRLTVGQALAELGDPVDAALNAEEALAKLQAKSYEVLLVDLKLPGMDGLALLKAARQLDARLAIVVITAHGSIETAVTAMKEGAFDFLRKPFTPIQIRTVVREALDRRQANLDRKELNRG